MEFSSITREVETWEVLEGAYVGKVTEKALQVHYEGEVFWVPKKVVDDAKKYPRWWQGEMTVKSLFARQAKMI